jgi:preprotein translocase subunit SecG
MNNQNVIIAVVAVVALAVIGFFFFQPDSGTEEGAAPTATTETGG